MSIFVYLAVLGAAANCAGMLYSGFGVWHFILFGFVGVMALIGLRMPGPDKTDARVVTALAVLLGVLPLVREPVRALRYSMKERAYGKEMAPIAAQWKETREKFSAEVRAWETKYHAPPVFDGVNAIIPQPPESGTALGAPGAQAAAVAPAPPKKPLTGGLTLPVDPFNVDRAPVRYWTNERDQWVIVSQGPDRAFDAKVPPLLSASDEGDGRGRWIYVNEGNFANLRYDPTNGSLGKGDLFWVSGTAEATADFCGSIVEAWSKADQTMSSAPRAADEALQGAAAARTLLTQGDALAAMAAATFSASKIPPYPAQQKPGDFEGRLIQGESLYALGDPRMAAAAVATYLNLSPNDPVAHFVMAQALYFSRDAEQSRREFAAAWQVDPLGPAARPAYDAMTAIGKGVAPPVPPPGSALRQESSKSPAGGSGAATVPQPAATPPTPARQQ